MGIIQKLQVFRFFGEERKHNTPKELNRTDKSDTKEDS